MQTLPRPERLEARTRNFARIGGLFSDRRMSRDPSGGKPKWPNGSSRSSTTSTSSSRREPRPGPSRIGAYQRRGAVSTLTLVAARVPFQAMFNVTGQPAAVVPWGLDGDGVPTSIQLVGRPFDEATLLSLGAQIEKARPWAHRRPPVS